MRTIGSDWVAILFLILAIGSITIGLQSSIGNATIYAQELEQKREELHHAILANKAPGEKSWAASGAATTNLRVGVVYLAEGIRKTSGLSLSKVYLLLDTVFLFSALAGLFFYLRKWLPDVYCLIGVLYLCSMLPLTYFWHYFQPWDRPQLALWILLLYLLRERRLVFLGACLAVSVIVKFDVMVLPGLYFLTHVSRERWQRVTLESVGLSVIALGTYAGLKWLFPTPIDTDDLAMRGGMHVLRHNIEVFQSLHISYPPLLFHGVVILLSVIGLRSRERFVWVSVVFAAGLMLLFLFASRLEEVRAQTMMTVLLLPAALLSLRELLERRNNQPQIDPAARR